jgi:hypothetical protein
VSRLATMPAAATRPTGQATAPRAVIIAYKGLGFVFSEHDPYSGADGTLRVLHLSSEHLFDRRNDEIRLVELDLVPTAGGNHLCTIARETDEILLQG